MRQCGCQRGISRVSLLCVQDKGGLDVPSGDGELTFVLGQDRLPIIT